MKGLNRLIPGVGGRLCYAVFAGLVLMSSCANYSTPKELLPATGPAIMEISPWAVEVGGSGDTQIVFVKVMDRDRNPVIGQSVSARVEDPSVAIIEESALTDKNGLARFTVTGIGMPWYSEIIFTADSISSNIYVWKIGYGPFWHRRF